MDLKLYKYIRQHFLKDGIDLFDSVTQGKIEAYDTSIGFDVKALEAVKQCLKYYNRYLETQKVEKVTLRYYQIMALYFTEVFFRNRNNKDFEDFTDNALAYWMATGSGKTIIMHINIFQFIEHNKGFKDLELIMTTPGVNLIEQHEREVTPLIEYLNKSYKNKVRLTIDTTSALLNKADDFFNFPDDKSRQRLILVDEAHIGLGSSQKDDEGAFLDLRRRLNIKHSFLFEYSATFHNISTKLEKEYSKSIIYDYNYNLFYRDGYGKDFYFQKIGSDLLKDNYKDNLDLNLRVIEQKLDVFSKIDYAVVKDLFRAETFPDRPLIAFMGNTVNDKTKEGKGEDELSDISEIVKYFAGLTIPERAKFRHIFNNSFNGKLKLTRNPQADDEILLSYGSGDYWGIINVGNGLNYINNYKEENVEKVTTTSIVISNNEKYLFENIDKPQSPINVLIGSRKFAEGWNCFRVSVIGLINLGKTKGNKIIQIFGRGVRLKGLKNDGKRKHTTQYIDDYFKLKDNDADNMKRLETLCVFSLQKSYLEVFTEAISGELEITKSFDISVKPSLIKLNGGSVTYEACSNELKIFKLAKTSIDVKKVFLSPKDRKIEYEYKFNGELCTAEINHFLFSLDYRVDRAKDGKNIRNLLINTNRDFPNYINTQSFNKTIVEQSDEADIQLYCKSCENGLSVINMIDVLEYIDEIQYKQDIDEFDFDFIEIINSKVAEEFVKKVRNKINWHLNSSIYQYEEPLKQSIGDKRGDFIEKYTLVKSFKLSKENGKTKTETELNKEIEGFEKTIKQLENTLTLDKLKIGNHIYSPLLIDNKYVLEQDLKLTPDKLNDGEKKFVKDFAEFMTQNSLKFKDFDVFLMRNVESLKSIGIYLNDDSEVFYPDFIIWLISKDIVYINFVDPKGQMGTKDLNTDDYKEKITIADKANNPTLTNIEKELKRIHKKEFTLNSFILLRDTSDLGKHIDSDWKKTHLISKSIFRLDWHKENEKGNITNQTDWVDGKTYLDWMMEKTLC
jgi:hypothetical protein